MKHNNPHPKFKKPYLSWKGRAESMREFLTNNGFTVEYERGRTNIIGWERSFFDGRGNTPCRPVPVQAKRWWQVWKWW